jgi:phosphatidylserine synthase
MSITLIINILGWVGTILYLVAYALVSMKKVEGDSVLYQGMNIVAGALLVINTLYLHAYPSAGLNAAWIGIGMVTLGRRWLTRS